MTDNNDISTTISEHFNSFAQSMFRLPTFLKTVSPASPVKYTECDEIITQFTQCLKQKDHKADCVLLQEKLFECINTFDKVS